MKKLLLIILLILIPLKAYCIDAEIVGIYKDEEKQLIWLAIEYNINGEKITNDYPVKYENIIGKNEEEINLFVDTNVKYQLNNYVIREFKKNNKDVEIILKNKVGNKYTANDTIVEIDINYDKKMEKVKLNMDGTYEKINNN
jgi:hypothetical protein